MNQQEKSELVASFARVNLRNQILLEVIKKMKIQVVTCGHCKEEHAFNAKVDLGMIEVEAILAEDPRENEKVRGEILLAFVDRIVTELEQL